MVKTKDSILALRTKTQELWAKACAEDKIPVDSQFVVFSPGNKYEAEYNEAMADYLAACRRFEHGV